MCLAFFSLSAKAFFGLLDSVWAAGALLAVVGAAGTGAAIASGTPGLNAVGSSSGRGSWVENDVGPLAARGSDAARSSAVGRAADGFELASVVDGLTFFFLMVAARGAGADMAAGAVAVEVLVLLRTNAGLDGGASVAAEEVDMPSDCAEMTTVSACGRDRTGTVPTEATMLASCASRGSVLVFFVFLRISVPVSAGAEGVPVLAARGANAGPAGRASGSIDPFASSAMPGPLGARGTCKTGEEVEEVMVPFQRDGGTPMSLAAF